jgi:hypothetical protein
MLLATRIVSRMRRILPPALLLCLLLPRLHLLPRLRLL